MAHPIVRHAFVVLAVLLALLVSGAVAKHFHDSFGGVTDQLSPGATTSTQPTPVQPAPVQASLSPDDRVFLAQARDAAPSVASGTDEDLLALAFTVRDAYLSGITAEEMIEAILSETPLPRVEVGNLVRLAVAVYCTAREDAARGETA